MADLIPHNSGRRLARGTQQALDYRDTVALMRAKNMAVIANTTEHALMVVARLADCEANLVKQVPMASARLEAITDTATGVIASQLILLAQDLG